MNTEMAKFPTIGGKEWKKWCGMHEGPAKGWVALSRHIRRNLLAAQKDDEREQYRNDY